MNPPPRIAYGIVREHLATFLAYTESIYTAPLPRYVVDTFEHYLGCGDLARGFLRCHCDDCGHDVLVAFSCKVRGICPSCGTRRTDDGGVCVHETPPPWKDDVEEVARRVRDRALRVAQHAPPAVNGSRGGNAALASLLAALANAGFIVNQTTP